MTYKTEDDKFNACLKLLDKGNYVKAVKLAESLSNDYSRAEILIDGGFALRDSSKVRNGIMIFERYFVVRRNHKRHYQILDFV